MPTCTMIIGVPRSGTNCVAGVLAKLGVYMGKNFLPACDIAPSGFYQDLEFEVLCDSIFGALFQPPYPFEIDDKNPDVQRIRDLIHVRDKAGVNWGVKLKHGAYLVDLFQQECESLQLLVTSRPRQNSIDSLAHYIGVEAATAAIDNSTQVINAALKKGISIVSADYDTLVQTPAVGVSDLAAVVGKEVKQEAVDWVDPSQNRYGGG